MNSRLIIGICRHTFPDGRRCLAPALRGRRCCRHHLDARTRLHAMARRRRLASFARLCVPMTRSDVDLNRIEIMRVINTGCLDFATARMLLWSMDIAAATFSGEPKTRPRRARNPNVFYYEPIKSLFSGSCIENLLQAPENTRGVREGGTPRSVPRNPTQELVGLAPQLHIHSVGVNLETTAPHMHNASPQGDNCVSRGRNRRLRNSADAAGGGTSATNSQRRSREAAAL